MYTAKTYNGRAVHSEDVTLSNASTASGSTIDFVGKGKGFVAFINTAGGALAGAVTTDLQGSFDGSTWVDLDASFAADCNGAVVAAAYDVANGDYPYYRLEFDSAANDSSNEINVAVVPGS